MPDLTRDEAQTRAELLTVRRATVALDLTRGDELFGSSTVIEFSTAAAGDTFAELRPAALHRVVLDGEDLGPVRLDDNRLPLTGLRAGDHELRVEADMRYSRTGEGMHRFTDPADGETYVYSQCFLSDVQRVFAAFDQPDLKAVFACSVTAPGGWTVLGNGIAARTPAPGPADGAGSGAVHWRIAPTPRISPYLVAFAAGRWHSVRTEHAGLPFGLHVRRSLGPHLDRDAAELLDITRGCFDRYHEIFDEPYPFDSYDQAFVPEFNVGAMENPGLVTLRDEYIPRSAVTETERQTRAVTIAHEMAHMWFGDLVTLRWWDDIWLNESFAEYMGYQTVTEATAFTGAWTDFAVARKCWGYDADQRPTTHPVAPLPEDVPDTASALLNFDGISYSKGAAALRQLVAWLGEKDFLAGINDHFTRHRFGNATLADFIGSLARASGRDVHTWADRWLRTTGVDTLTAAVAEAAGTEAGTEAGAGAGRAWELTVRHTGSRPHRVTVSGYDRADDPAAAPVLRGRFSVDVPADGDAPARVLPGSPPGLVLLNTTDDAYAKIRLDPGSLDTALAALSALPDPLTRATVWTCARDLVRDGALAPGGYLDAARAHLLHEHDNAVVQGVLGFARHQIADLFLPPDARPVALATLTTVCRDLLRRTADGADPGLRLTAVRTFLSSSTDPAELSALLAEGTFPGGPPLDPELRWQLLHRLAVLGAADADTIDAELARDPGATGREGAARCRAALPDPRAKEAAWQALFGSDDLSNRLVTATAEGFWHPEQHDLLTGYAERYFPAAVAAAARRGPAIAEALGRQGFPFHSVTPETLRLGEACLRDGGPVPALRRKLADQLDDLTRALRVRAALAGTSD